MSITIETIITCDSGVSVLCEGTYADGDQRNIAGGAQRKGYTNDPDNHRWWYNTVKNTDCCPYCHEVEKVKS